MLRNSYSEMFLNKAAAIFFLPLSDYPSELLVTTKNFMSLCEVTDLQLSILGSEFNVVHVVHESMNFQYH